ELQNSPTVFGECVAKPQFLSVATQCATSTLHSDKYPDQHTMTPLPPEGIPVQGQSPRRQGRPGDTGPGQIVLEAAGLERLALIYPIWGIYPDNQGLLNVPPTGP